MQTWGRVSLAAVVIAAALALYSQNVTILQMWEKVFPSPSMPSSKPLKAGWTHLVYMDDYELSVAMQETEYIVDLFFEKSVVEPGTKAAHVLQDAAAVHPKALIFNDK